MVTAEKMKEQEGEGKEPGKERAGSLEALKDLQSKRAELAKVQQKRVTTLAVHIAARLEPWVAGEEETFVQVAKSEYDELCKCHFGPEMLSAIGIQYELVANYALGFKGNDWFGGRVDNRKMVLLTSAMMGMLRVANDTNSIQKGKLDRLNEEEKAKAMEELAEKMKLGVFGLLASMSVASVGAAVSMVLADTSVTKEVRRSRARGLIKLGRIFQGKTTDRDSCISTHCITRA
eukprot:7082004-Prymnesium_polylepis.1